MEYGKVKRYFPERGFGFIQATTGQEIFFHIRQQRELHEDLLEPRFGSEEISIHAPQRDDLVVFRSVQGTKGLQTAEWGFREDYDRVKARCWPIMDPKVAVRFPFLPEILMKAKRHDDNGSFEEIATSRLSAQILLQKGLDRFMTGKRLHFYAVILKGNVTWDIRALKSESWWPDGTEEGFTPAKAISEQLEEMDIPLDQLYAIVEVDTSGEAPFFGDTRLLSRRNPPRQRCHQRLVIVHSY